MNTEMISSFTGQSENVIAPVQEMNRLIIDNAEKLVALQIASMQSYAALGIATVKELVEIKDADTYKAYIEKQNELIKGIGEQFMSDAKAITELGSDFGEKVRNISQKNVKVITKKAA